MYVKLFSSILDSSVWSEDHATVRVWITMLVMADEDGVVRASNSGLERRACVSADELQHALKALSEPDLDSRSVEWGGRRIERIEGGWLVLNYNKYREIRTKRQVRDAERQRRHRARQAQQGRDTSRTSHDVTVTPGDAKGSHTPSTPEAEAEAETEAEAGTTTTTEKSNLPVRRGNTHAAIRDHLTAVLQTVSEDHDRRATKKEIRTVMVEVVFAYWQAKTGHLKSRLDKKREARLRGELEANGGNIHELLYAIDGWFRDPTFKKQAEEGQLLDGIDNIFRNRERIERLAGHMKGYREEQPHKMAVKYLDRVVY